MSSQPITHKSGPKHVDDDLKLLESSNKNRVKCEWFGYDSYDNDYEYIRTSLKWYFDWQELKSTGVERLSGHIILISSDNEETIKKIDVDFTSGNDTIGKTIEIIEEKVNILSFEYHLTPKWVQKKVTNEGLFAPSKKNDTILVIDGKKLHVNKVFLSFHSDFFAALFSSNTSDRNGYFSIAFDSFRALFSSNFKEGKMNEIPIQDVSYEDFGLLMSNIYPETVHLNDNTVEKLLQLAHRFMIPAVIGHVEHHLLHNSEISHEKMIFMADKYRMPELLKKCISEIDSLEKYQKLATSAEYKKLSANAKVDILDILIVFL